MHRVRVDVMKTSNIDHYCKSLIPRQTPLFYVKTIVYVYMPYKIENKTTLDLPFMRVNVSGIQPLLIWLTRLGSVPFLGKYVNSPIPVDGHT